MSEATHSPVCPKGLYDFRVLSNLYGLRLKIRRTGANLIPKPAVRLPARDTSTSL